MWYISAIMLKRLAILGLLLIVWPLPGGPQPVPLKNPKNSQPVSHQAETGNGNQISLPPVPTPPSTKDDGQKGDKSTTNGQNQSTRHSFDYGKWGFTVSIFVALTSLVVAIASLVQAIAAKESADETKETSRFTEKTVRESERADVLLERAVLTISPTGQIDEHSWVQLGFRNFGRTRAKDVVIESHLLVEENGRQTHANKQRFGTVTLGAGQEKQVDLQRLNEAFMAGTPTKILQGTGRLRFYATVSYEDVFGSAYCPQFIGSYDLRTSSFSIDQTS